MPNNTNFIPGYVKLHRTGELKKRGEELWARMKTCDLCPRECGAERLNGERGFCEANADLEIASYHPHFGDIGGSDHIPAIKAHDTSFNNGRSGCKYEQGDEPVYAAIYGLSGL